MWEKSEKVVADLREREGTGRKTRFLALDPDPVAGEDIRGKSRDMNIRLPVECLIQISFPNSLEILNKMSFLFHVLGVTYVGQVHLQAGPYIKRECSGRSGSPCGHTAFKDEEMDTVRFGTCPGSWSQ